MENNKKLVVEDLTISFRTNQGMVRAVRGVSFDVTEGETLAIVGESGSGKSVTNRAVMGILAGNAVIDKGSIMYEGQDLTKIDEANFHKIRGHKIGMIFQDPMSSLNPIMKIGKQITEGMLINGDRLKRRQKEIAHEFSIALANAKHEKNVLIRQYKEELSSLKATGDKGKITELKDDHKVKLIKANQKIKDAALTYQIELKKAKVVVDKELAEKMVETKERILPLREQLIKVNEDKKAKLALLAKLDKKDDKSKKDVKGKKDVSAKKLIIQSFNNKRKEIRKEIFNLQEGLRRFQRVTKLEARERALKVMREVGIPEPEKRMKQYPFQFSGGMRQRIVIAIALTADPDILICDEPTTALDVTIQAQILELIKNLKETRNLTVIFITHDLGVVANMADRVAVMYAGKIVEIGTADEIFYNPKHPYTWALLSSMPDLNSKERLTAIPGTPPNMLFPPVGDAFAERNSYAMKIDFEQEPPYFKVSDTHYAATWLLHKDAPKVEMPKVIRERIKASLDTAEEGVTN